MLIDVQVQTVDDAHVVFYGGRMEVRGKAGDVHPIFSVHLTYGELCSLVTQATEAQKTWRPMSKR